MIFYFNGTGNSYWTAKTLGGLLNEPTENIVRHRQKTLDCGDEVIGFVCSLYIWNLPSVVKSVLENAVLNKDSYIFLVLTSNNGEKNLGDKCPAYKSMADLLEKAGGKLSSVFMLQMPGNAIESSPEENKRRLESAPDKVKNFAEDINNRVSNYIPKPESFAYKIMKKRAKRSDNSKPSVMGQFAILESCDGCGICAKICPMDNIHIASGKAVHGVDCATCLACLHWCPKHATISKISMLKERPQYTHPNVTMQEMISSKGV